MPGSCENDEVFAPATRKEWGDTPLRETSFAQAFGIVVMLVVGWMPGYLIFNFTGPAKYRGKDANHFSPWAVFFKDEEFALIVQTDIAYSSAVALMFYCIYTFGELSSASEQKDGWFGWVVKICDCNVNVFVSVCSVEFFLWLFPHFLPSFSCVLIQLRYF
jgi:hypothetical protein